MGNCPMTKAEITNRYFFENRARLLDLAAFLDRLDRANDGDSGDDFRLRAFREALEMLSGDDRTRRIQMFFSDPTTEPLEQVGFKGTHGAYDHWSGEDGK